MKTRLLPLLAFALAAPSFAQDECSSALSIGPGIFALDTSTVTQSPEAWSCAGGGGPDIWFSFTVGANTVVTLDLCGSTYDTALEVFDGDDCANLSLLACNDDACGLQSSLTFAGVTGQTYLFRVGGFNGAFGNATLEVSAVNGGGVPNDECSGALLLDEGVTAFSTIGALTSSPSWGCASGGSDIWYTFTADGTSVEVSTCGSGYDTALEAFSGTCGSLTSIGCLDDSCGLQTELFLSTVPGGTYFVRVGGFGGAVGSGMLTLTGSGTGEPGVNYCMANPNSTGAAATMSATGSAAIADNDLTLLTSSMPPNTFCAYMTSLSQGFSPNFGGSDGNLCLGGSIGLYSDPSDVQRTSLNGEASLTVDLLMLPTSSGGTVAAMAGQSWNFQAWFRDASLAGGGSNFSDGLSILLF